MNCSSWGLAFLNRKERVTKVPKLTARAANETTLYFSPLTCTPDAVLRQRNVQALFEAKLVRMDSSIAMGEATYLLTPASSSSVKAPKLTSTPDASTTRNLMKTAELRKRSQHALTRT